MATVDKASTRRSAPARPLDVERLRQDFPALALTAHGKPLAYLDNAATTQKPESVLAEEQRCYREYCSNVHRGVHYLSEKATAAYEAARVKVQRFLNAERADEVIFVRGTTEAINLVASSFGRGRVRAGDRVLITEMEHHSNIVPWQLLCEGTGATLEVAPIDDRGQLVLEDFERLLTERTKLFAVTQVSNALGTVNPIGQLIELAHRQGIPVLVDGAQAVPHMAVDVRATGCDFFAFSGHKMFAPTGIGVLYGRHELLAAMPPYQGGGEMIRSVRFEKTTFAEPPARFEAGTPNIAGAVALGAAIDYLGEIGFDAVGDHEQELLRYATEAMGRIPGLRIIGTAEKKAGVVSFVIDNVHAHDIGTILDREGIAVRAGHHCAQPVMRRYGVPATARASLALYNTREEIDRLVAGIARVGEIFS